MENMLAVTAVGLSGVSIYLLVQWLLDPTQAYYARTLNNQHMKERAVTAVQAVGASSLVERIVEASKLERELERVRKTLPASYYFSVTDAFVLVLLTCAVMGAVCGVLAQSVLGAACGFMLGIIPWYVHVSKTEEKKQKALHEGLPEVFRSLSVALSAGKSVQQALKYVGEKMDGVVGQEFARSAYELEMGTPAAEVLQQLENNITSPAMKLLGSALAISQRTGCALQGLFEKAGRAVEKSSELERELKVKTSQAQLSARIVSLLPLVLLAGIALLSPDFREGIFTPLGAGCVVIGLFLDGIGLLVIRSILKVEV